MAIHESKKQSDLEKRLKLLRQQVYGKAGEEKLDVRSKKIEYPASNFQSPTSNYQTDITYLYQDLFKILFLSSAAIAVQLLLFILTRNHILNLNFF